MVRQLGNQIANPVYVVHAGGDPFASRISIDDGPDKSGIQTANRIEIFPKRLQPVSAPNIVLRIGMANGFEILVERVLMQYANF